MRQCNPQRGTTSTRDRQGHRQRNEGHRDGKGHGQGHGKDVGANRKRQGRG